MPVAPTTNEHSTAAALSKFASPRFLWSATATAVTISLAWSPLTQGWFAVQVLALGLSVALSLGRAAGKGKGLGPGLLLPVGIGLVFAVVGLISLLAGLFLVQIYSETFTARAMWTILAVIPLGVCWFRGGRVGWSMGDTWSVSSTGSIWFIGLSLAGTLPLPQFAAQVANSTDFVRHLIMVKGVAQWGSLNFSGSEYPKGLHAATTWVWQTGADPSFSAGYLALQHMLWLIGAATAGSLVAIAWRLAKTLLPHSRIAPAVAAVLGFLSFLLGPWFSAQMSGGFLTGLGAGFVLSLMLWVIVFERELGPTTAVLLFAAFGAFMALVWPPLVLPAFGAVVLVTLLFWFRGQVSWQQCLLVAGIMFWSIPAVVHLTRTVWNTLFPASGDIGAADTGPVFPAATIDLPIPNLSTLLLGLFSVAGLVLLWRTGKRLQASAVIALNTSMVVATGAIIAVAAADDIWTYFSRKALWTVALLLTPVSCALVAWLAATVIRKSGAEHRRSLAMVFAAIGVLLVFACGATIGVPPNTPAPYRLGDRIPAEIPVVTYLENNPNELVDYLALGTALQDEVPVWPGLSDRVASEALAWNYNTPQLEVEDWIKLLTPDPVWACNLLRDSPKLGVITVAPARDGSVRQRLLDSGCPPAVVNDREWIDVPLDDLWSDPQ